MFSAMQAILFQHLNHSTLNLLRNKLFFIM